MLLVVQIICYLSIWALRLDRFLWVTFQIHDICRENNDEEIRKVLRSLPSGLNETYARILERIQKDRKPDVAKKVFQWLAAARRPLSLDELAESTALEPSRLLWDERCLPTSKLRVVQDCGNLVTYRKEDNIVQFAHSTVLEFLLSSPLTPEVFISSFSMKKPEADLYVGKICLTYLSFPEFETQLSHIPKEPGCEISALDMPVSEWVPSMVGPGQGLIWGIARRCLMPGQPSTVAAGRYLPQATPSQTAPTPSDMLSQKFNLLEYISSQWII